LSFLVAKK